MGGTWRLSDGRLHDLGLLLEVLCDERRWEHALLVVGKLRGIGVLLGVRVGDGLIESAPHRNMVGEVGGETAIEVGRAGLEVSGQSSVLKREVVVFLFIHLLVDDILFGHSQRTTRSSLVNLRSSSGRLNASLETAITSPRSSDVCSEEDQSTVLRHDLSGQAAVPLLILFVSPLGFDRLCRRDGSLRRHNVCEDEMTVCRIKGPFDRTRVATEHVQCLGASRERANWWCYWMSPICNGTGAVATSMLTTRLARRSR